MDKILIENYEVIALHGVNPEEKINPQRFLISAEIESDFSRCSKSDDINQTASYSAVCKMIKSFVGENSFDLIETIASGLAKKILLGFPIVKGVKVVVKKPDAPMKGVFDYVGVSTEMCWHKTYLALGSNLGDKEGYLDIAVNEINADSNFRNMRESARIETAPYGGVADEMFVNSVVEVETLYSPYELLDAIHQIEEKGNRVRKERWGNRTLDVDIVFYDDLIMGEKDLAIPHPDMVNRDFVLTPMMELNENFVHPLCKKRIKELKLFHVL